MSTTGSTPRTNDVVAHMKRQHDRLEHEVEKLIDRALVLYYAQIDLKERMFALETKQ